eukprot:scaffold210438_cov30-Tisochrysis_lutea.AAC.1
MGSATRGKGLGGAVQNPRRSCGDRLHGGRDGRVRGLTSPHYTSGHGRGLHLSGLGRCAWQGAPSMVDMR